MLWYCDTTSYTIMRILLPNAPAHPYRRHHYRIISSRAATMKRIGETLDKTRHLACHHIRLLHQTKTQRPLRHYHLIRLWGSNALRIWRAFYQFFIESVFVSPTPFGRPYQQTGHEVIGILLAWGGTWCGTFEMPDTILLNGQSSSVNSFNVHNSIGFKSAIPPLVYALFRAHPPEYRAEWWGSWLAW